jgi:hypothetical protein
MARKIVDCRRFESESNCTMTFIGEEDEVVATAAAHAEAVHGHADTPEMRSTIQTLLEDEGSYIPGAREPEPFPA